MLKIQEETINRLRKKASKIRIHIIDMLYEAGSGHPGGSLSATDIITALYFFEMRVDPKKPQWEDRDRFVLSKGHACPALYAALAERGFFAVKTLRTLRKSGSTLQGHPDMKATPGVDFTTGSLGHGLSVAIGMALGARTSGKGYRVFSLLGDGEIQEGIIWEAAMAASYYKVDNLIAIIDCNGLQVDGRVSEIMGIEPVVKKWQAFGWHTMEINGHNMEEILNALRQGNQTKGKPTVIIARTVKGKGVSFMENNLSWHARPPNREQRHTALRQLKAL